MKYFILSCLLYSFSVQAQTLSLVTEAVSTVPAAPASEIGPAKNAEYFSKELNHSTLEIGFEYPLNFGTHLKYYANSDFYARIGVGFMADFFLGTLSRIASYVGYLNEYESAVISQVFSNSFYADLRFGWFPYAQSKDGGPYIELGVSGMFFGKGEVPGFTLSRALNIENVDNTKYYLLKTNAYNGTLHIGYQIPFERLKFNVEAGLIKIFSTKQVQSDPTITAPKVLNEEQTQIFHKFLKTKGWIFPTVSGWVGFAF